MRTISRGKSRIAVTMASGLAASCIVSTGEFWSGDESSLAFSWTLSGAAAGSASCEDAGASAVRMSISLDSGIHHWYDDFEWSCSAGSVDTGLVFAGGTYILTWQLVDSSRNLIASLDERIVTLEPGTNDLGSIDFVIESGPLDVDLGWDTGSAYGDCTASGADVMGYLLRTSTGAVADEVDIDADPVACSSHLYWPALPLDVYSLVLDARDPAGASTWGAECTNLVVDDTESNAFACDVPLTGP